MCVFILLNIWRLQREQVLKETVARLRLLLIYSCYILFQHGDSFLPINVPLRMVDICAYLPDVSVTREGAKLRKDLSFNWSETCSFWYELLAEDSLQAKTLFYGSVSYFMEKVTLELITPYCTICSVKLQEAKACNY